MSTLTRKTGRVLTSIKWLQYRFRATVYSDLDSSSLALINMAKNQWNILEFLLYYTKFVQFFGLLRYNPRNTKSCPIRTFYMVFVIICFLSLFLINLYFIFSFKLLYEKFDLLEVIIFIILYGFEMLSSFSSFIISFFFYKQTIKLQNTLIVIEKLLSQINIKLEYDKRYWWIQISILTLYSLLRIIYDIIILYEIPHFLANMSIKHICFIIIGLDLCYFKTVLLVFRNHFKVINDEFIRMKKLYECDSSLNGEFLIKIRVLYETHLILYKLCHTHDALYSTQIIFLYYSTTSKLVTFTYSFISQNVTYFTTGKSAWGDHILSYSIYLITAILEKLFIPYFIINKIVETKVEVSIFNNVYYE